MKNKFLDQLDSSCGDAIGNTYEDASEKVLLRFKNDSNDDATIYFKNPKSIKFSDFKISWTLFRGNILVSFTLNIDDNDNLSISTQKTKPIHNVSLIFNFYLQVTLNPNNESKYEVSYLVIHNKAI